MVSLTLTVEAVTLLYKLLYTVLHSYMYELYQLLASLYYSIITAFSSSFPASPLCVLFLHCSDMNHQVQYVVGLSLCALGRSVDMCGTSVLVSNDLQAPSKTSSV